MSGGGRRTRLAALTAAILLPLAGACSTGGRTIDEPPAPPAEIHDDWPGCLALGAFKRYVDPPPDLGAGSVPPSFRPEAAVLCAIQDGAGATPTPAATAGLERRATGASDLDALLSYLALPSQRVSSPDDLACPAMGWNPPWLFLLDGDGRWIQPQIPLDPCGFARNLFATDDHALPYGTMDFDDTVVCRSKADADWNCRPV